MSVAEKPRQEKAFTVPDHVPPELVVDLDIYDLPGGAEDPHRAWTLFRGHGPIVYSPYNEGHWVPVTAEHIMAMWRNSTGYSSRSVSIPDHQMDPQLPIEADAPDHAEYRRNIADFFSPAAVTRMEPEIRALAVRLIEGFRARGECEFISEFSEQLPLIVFLALMGLPQSDRIMLHDIVVAFARHPDLGVKQQAYRDLRAYLDGWLDHRTRQPGDDAISRIVAARIGDRPYTRNEMLSTCSLLLLGGLDTVASSLGFWALHLARNPMDRAQVRGRRGALLPVINEFMRRYPIPSLGRVVVEDMVVDGIEMRAGDRVLLSPVLYNLDPARFDAPERVDFDRPSHHIGFGAGPHMCAGANLARCEFRIFLEEWLDRIPDFEVDESRLLRMRAAPTNTVEELWLRWPV